MKKYIICSDVHGSIDTFRNVVDYFLKNGCDKLIILGDLLYHGPRNDIPDGYNPKEVIKLVNSIKDKVIMVKGNCESEVDEMVLDFRVFKKRKIKYLSRNIYLEHGHHLDFNHNCYISGDIVFYGHTHISKFDVINGVSYINPGSVTIPKNNTKKSFVVLDGYMCNLVDLNGNRIEEFSLFEKEGD